MPRGPTVPLGLAVLLLVFPGRIAVAQDPLTRLRQLLPQAEVERVLALVSEARTRGLPERALLARILEGAAKGAPLERLLLAGGRVVEDLATARSALEQGGRIPLPEEIEAGAVAVDLGVGGGALAGLAASAPSGRSLVVPLAVVAELVGRGLPVDHAIAAVRSRLDLASSDVELAALPEIAAQLLAEGASAEFVADWALRGPPSVRLPSSMVPGSAIPVGGGPPIAIPPSAGAPGSRPRGPVGPPGRPGRGTPG